jgi:phage gp36-like protein
MYLAQEELKNVIYEYQIAQITEDDVDIVEMAIAAAIEEVKSYFTANYQQRFTDGRYVYDVDAIFAAEDEERNPLVLQMTKTVALWHVIQLCNADLIYEHIKERYDRAVAWLKKLANGEVTLTSLPRLDLNSADNPNNRDLFIFGSRTKFNYE